MSGSPPLARDKYILSIANYDELGITPACAGQIFLSRWHRSNSQDHPRLRGTNDFKAYMLDDTTGSPPLARDKFH